MLPPAALLIKYQQEPALFLNDAIDDYPRWDKQIEIIESVRDNRNTYVKSCHGVGKCFQEGTLILMYDGTIKSIENIEVGDLVLGPDSLPKKVLSLGSGKEKMYEIIPTKGESFSVNESHILSLKTKRIRGKKSKGQILNITVKDYLELSESKKYLYGLYRTGVDFNNNVKLPIDPYFLGIWLGDGTSNRVGITTIDKEIVDTIYDIAQENNLRVVINNGNKKRTPTYMLSGKINGPVLLRNKLLNKFNELNLIKNKHIPQIYKTSNRKQRLELLAGLIDTDGYKTNGGYSISMTNEKLVDDIVFLAKSLGFAAYKKTYTAKIKSIDYKTEAYKVTISGDCSIIPVKIIRKKQLPRKQIKDVLITGFTVRSKGIGQYYGIELGGDHLFLLADFTVVHNTFTAKDVVLWFLYCFRPSKVLTTAPSWPQVEKLLWSEINSAHKNAKTVLGGTCLKTAINLDPEWFALGISPKIETNDDGNRVTGFHSPNMLVVFDEAPAVNPKLWQIKETLMTSENVKFLGIGNPVTDSGEFFNGFTDKSVNSISMSIFDSPNFQANGVTNKESLIEIVAAKEKQREQILSRMNNPFAYLTTVRWAVERVLAWGENSPMTQARVFGEFPDKTDDTIISYSTLERCKNIIVTRKHQKVLGVDVARFGIDFTCFIGYDNGYQSYKDKWNGQDTVLTANKIINLIRQGYYIVVIDDTGLGGGVTDQVNDFLVNTEYKNRVTLMPVNFAEAAYNDDYDGIVTEMYFDTKDLLESGQINVVDDGDLFAELSNRKYKFTNKGRFKVESKDEYKKRTGLNSPDESDAFVLAMRGIKYGTERIVLSEGGERETAGMDW